MKFPSWLLELTVAVVLVFTVRFLWPSEHSRSPASLSGGGYCLAIRGNGDAMPGHWGSLALALETFGVPRAVAGGSSASITAFLLDSVADNPLLLGGERDLRAAFLVKSFQGFIYGIGHRPGWGDLLAILKAFSAPKGEKSRLRGVLERIEIKRLGQQLDELIGALEEAKASKVYYGPGIAQALELAREVKNKPSMAKLRQLMFTVKQLQTAFAVFGKFDAKNDKNLFVRDGIVSFPALAHLFGRMGDFYSLRGASPATRAEAERYFAQCTPGSVGLTWSKIIERNPACQKDLEALSNRYFDETEGKEFRVKEEVGAHMPTLVSTSIIRGSSAEGLRALKATFDSGKDPNAGEKLSVRAEDISFGYFGQEEDLRTVEAALDRPDFPGGKSQLDKSRRFLSLGPVSWLTALSVSPAEPGLSTFTEFTARGMNYTSMGGWSDLHPMPVLKALGCESVVYLTRVGGDSIFVQGVAKRVFGFTDIGWDRLDYYNHENVVANFNGQPGNLDGEWSKQYNVANPRSSYAASLAMADAVVCTHWDDYDIKTEFTKLVEGSYDVPVYIQKPGKMRVLREPAKQIREQDNAMDPSLGYRPYAGCIPFAK